MTDRKGEKIGWTAGWIGGFIWVALLSLMFLFQNKLIQGILGLVLTATAIGGIIRFAPWRYPLTPYWRLIIVPYALFALAVLWAVWSFGAFKDSVFSGWMLCWMLPLLIPIVTIGRRRWTDHSPKDRPADASGPRPLG